jgi:hypothetical protein
MEGGAVRLASVVIVVIQELNFVAVGSYDRNDTTRC